MIVSSGAPVALPSPLVDAARAVLTGGTTQQPAVIAVDGPAGSGKTTVAGALGRELAVEHRAVPVIHMDDLYPGWDGLNDAVPRLLEWVLEPLWAGQRPRWRRYDWDAGSYAEWHEEPRAPAYVVEGVACGSLPSEPYLGLLVWVDASLDTRHRRGIDRDGETFRPHWERWAAQEDAHFAAHRTRERADLRLTTDNGEPRLAG